MIIQILYERFKLWLCGNSAYRNPFSPIFLARHYLDEAVGRWARLFVGDYTVLDVGCGTQPYRRYFRHYIGFDVSPVTPDTMKCDSNNLNEIFYRYNYVLCTEVLEHLPEPVATIRRIASILTETGKVIITVPMTYPLHHPTDDYWRFTDIGLRQLLHANGLRVIDMRPCGGFVAVVAQLFLYYVNFEMLHRRRHDWLWYVAGAMQIIATPVLLVLNMVINITALWLDRIIKKSFITLNNAVLCEKNGG